MTRILVTGSRDFTHTGVVLAYFERACIHLTGSLDGSSLTVVHGACGHPKRLRGADGLADRIAHDLDWTVEPHPADWRASRTQAGHWRNQHMVNLGAALCLAFFAEGAANGGTADCVARATAADIPVWRYPRPEGVTYW